jgi:hypothetical protein
VPLSAETHPNLHGSDIEAGAHERLNTLISIVHHSVPRSIRISVDQQDRFSYYSVQWQPWYDVLLNNIMAVFAPRAWPVFHITGGQGAKWEVFMA